jgi:hypothetical protein
MIRTRKTAGIVVMAKGRCGVSVKRIGGGDNTENSSVQEPVGMGHRSNTGYENGEEAGVGVEILRRTGRNKSAA